MKMLSLTLLFFLTACSSAQKTAKVYEVKYYYGAVDMSSPDGKIPYGKSVSLIKRTVDEANMKIIEIVLQPPRNPKQKAKDIFTTLTQLDGGNTFAVSDEDKSFTGKMVFEGNSWLWDKWIYDIKLADGSKLTGNGILNNEGIKTVKTFFKPDGSAAILIKEDVKLISAEEYEKQHGIITSKQQ